MIIHNGLFAECEVLDNFWELCGPRTRTCGPSTRTRTCKLVLEDKDFSRGQQHCKLLCNQPSGRLICRTSTVKVYNYKFI